MNMNRSANSLAIVGGLFLLMSVPGLANTQSAAPNPAHAPKPANAGAQPRQDSLQDDFSGLNYTDDQKAEIDKIRQKMVTLKDTVQRDDKLTADQKDAMLTGYTRMEYVAMFKVLTPVQQRQVKQKINARRIADHAAMKK